MNTDIGFLRTLERDLDEAASRSAAHGTHEDEAVGDRRRIAWISVAAVVVALLVVAGGIGFISQKASNRSSAEAPGLAAPHYPRITPDTLQGLKSGQAGDTSVGSFTNPGAAGASLGAPSEGSFRGTDLSKIVRNGSISVEIANHGFVAGRAAVARIASDAHGFILSSTTSNETSGTFTLRVPASNFDAAMAELEKLGTVESSETSGKDVTAQYVDYTARLRILDGRRAVILRLMSKATTISETLQLNNEFDQVQLQIEQIQGNLNVLRNQVAESTIAVDIHEKDAPKATSSTVSTPRIGTSFRLAWQGFLRVIGAVIIGLGYLIPLTVLALGIWVVTVVTRRRRATA
jgi:hypothetical protein